MIFFDQVNISVSVDRGGSDVISSSIYLDRNLEMHGYICADIRSYEIRDAWCETVKSCGNVKTGFVGLEFMKGMNAHIEGKRKALRHLKSSYDPKVRYLMEQCFNGLIQAESYVYRERGFKDKECYNKYWDILEENGCRMYRYPSETDLRWMDYIPQYERKHFLFSRFKNFELERNGDLCRGRGHFSDSYHELCAEIVHDRKSELIKECDIMYVRAPGAACFGNDAHGKKLEGMKLSELTGADIVDMFGRSEGCYHLVEILKDLIRLLK